MMNMNRVLKILGGVGAGLAAAYFLDPSKGAERRAKLKDKVSSLTGDAREALSHKMEDVKDTAASFAQDAKGFLAAGGGKGTAKAGFTTPMAGRSGKGIH